MERTITVTGHGKAVRKPDTIRIEGSIQAVCTTYEEAVAASVSCTSGLRNRLEGAGFDANMLRTVSVSVRPYYETDRSGDRYKNILVGYEYVHSLRMDIDVDGDSVDKVLSAMASSDSPVFTLEYRVSDPAPAMEEARRDAVIDARNNASQIALAADIKLGQIQSIRYGESRSNGPVMMCAKSVVSSDRMEPESVDFTDSVTIIWEIL